MDEIDGATQSISSLPYILPSLIGGFVGLARQLKRPDETWRSFSIRAVQHVLVCLFNGWLTFETLGALEVDPRFVGAACGLAGYLGPHALDFVTDVIKGRATGG